MCLSSHSDSVCVHVRACVCAFVRVCACILIFEVCPSIHLSVIHPGQGWGNEEEIGD